ncbi:MAG: hypothetical protein JWO30_3629 [Fibrobacteres bacterium]|nr:hypothetical protein [Fibrobacterota bacterium]
MNKTGMQSRTFTGAMRAVLLTAALLLGWSRSESANILFVVGSTTLNAGDSHVNDWLHLTNHTVTIKTGLAAVAGDTTGKDLVIISSTVTSADVNTKFKNVKKPVLTWEASLFNPMGMTGAVSGTDFGTTAAQTTVVVKLPAHALAGYGALTGTPTVYTSADIVSWGVPNANAIKVATLAGDATKWTYFAYETGSAMIGLTAPARRVAFLLADLGASKFNGIGDTFLQSAINWSLGYTMPVITLFPADATVNPGQTATFTMAATGVPTPTCTWYRQPAGTLVASTCTYVTAPVTAADDGAVFLANTSNAVTSMGVGTATLTVRIPPTVTSQSGNVTAVLGTSALFTAAASGTAPLSYQWRRGLTDIPGATAASYTIPSVAAADDGSNFSCRISNAAGTATTNPAVLTVLTPPVITLQPLNRTVTQGQTAPFTVLATGPGTLTYQWRKNGASIAGATDAVYITPPTVAADNNASFSVIVGNAAGTVTSIPVTLTVISPPVITLPPANRTVVVGQTAAFSVTATGASLTYQWRKNGGSIAGATAATYTTPPTVAGDNNASFDVIVANPAGSVFSAAAVLTVNGPPVINTQPAPKTVAPGQTAEFAVFATGNGGLTYQWRKNGTAIPGATLYLYTTPPVTDLDNGALFDVIVSAPGGSVTSAPALLTVSSSSAATYPFSDGFESGTFAPYWSFYKSNVLGRTIVTSAGIPYSGSYHAAMDVNSASVSTYNLNEMILTINLAGQSNVELSFFHKITGDEDEVLPASWNGHINGDGVSISANGATWYKARGTTVSEGGSETYHIFKVNLDAVAAAAGIAYNSTFQIKFQQYDDFATPTDGHFFDNIRLGAPLPNQPPTVAITSPTNGSVFTNPATVYIYNNAFDGDGSISKVDFYRGGTTLIGTSTVSPFTFVWSGVTPGAYSLTAVATDNQNATGTSAPVSITVNEAAPYVTATATPSTGGAPLNVAFTANNSGGTVTGWLWNFGDGSNTTLQNPTHLYNATGVYNVSVTGSGPGGNSTYLLTVTVVAAPNITITATPISGTRPLTVSFSVANTGGAINAYAWNFGNGGTSGSANPVFTYTTAGTFTATLTASGPGGSSAASRVITVNPIQYSLTMCATGNGTTSPPVGPLPGPINEGMSVPITATPAAGNQFETWRVQSGTVAIANPALPATSMVLSSNATVCADFHPNPVTLTVVHTGSGSTTPVSTGSVIPGRSFDISAVPAAGFTFLGWSVPSGDAVIANPAMPATHLTMTGASTVQAEFIPENIVPANKKLAISGELSDASGNRIGFPNPEIVDVSIRLWTALTGGTAAYSESFLAANSQGVTVDDGFFVARLGEGTTTGNLQQAISGNPQLWVEITVEGAAPDVLSPRTPLTASAYALGGVPTLVPLAGGVMHGEGDPNAIKAGASIGSYYVNDSDNSTWLKISSGWSQIR